MNVCSRIPNHIVCGVFVSRHSVVLQLGPEGYTEPAHSLDKFVCERIIL